MHEQNAKQPSPIAAGIAAAAVVAAAAGTVAGLVLASRRLQTPSTAPEGPLVAHGWWDADASSALAYAHPAVLIVDVTTGRVVDSWDRRSRTRVKNANVQANSEWPASGLIVVDSVTGDLLHTIADPQVAS